MDIAAIRRLRLTLWQRGYRPVPINEGGKYPYQKDWTILARQNPPWAVSNVHAWHPGTGILCDGLRAIDIDIDDPALAVEAQRIVESYGYAPYRYRHGSARRLYLFRAADGEPAKSYVANRQTKARVEILGKGNQCFAYGVHPSGEVLRWYHGPDTIARDDLPTLCDDLTKDILDQTGRLLQADRNTWRSINQTPLPVLEPNGEEWPIGDVISALNCIPNFHADYEWWFQVTCAVFDACGGSPEGYQAWVTWSRQCPAFDEREADKLWRALYDSPCYYSAGTLVHEARHCLPDWNRPSRVGFNELRVRFKPIGE